MNGSAGGDMKATTNITNPACPMSLKTLGIRNSIADAHAAIEHRTNGLSFGHVKLAGIHWRLCGMVQRFFDQCNLDCPPFVSRTGLAGFDPEPDRPCD